MLNFGERLKEEIEALNFDNRSFSKEIGIPESTISDWCRNKTQPYLRYLIQLADYFNYSIDYLVGKEPTKYEIVFKQCPPFSQMLRKFITERKTVIKFFSMDIGIHQSQVFKWLRGDTEPQLDSLIKIATYFGITIDILIGRQ